MNAFIRIATLSSTVLTGLCVAAPVNDQSYGAGRWASPKQLYEKTCAACHSTGVGPALKGLPFPPEAYAVFVRNGAGTMPAFKVSEFTDEELKSLALWLAKQPAPPTGDTK